jgi:amidase
MNHPTLLIRVLLFTGIVSGSVLQAQTTREGISLSEITIAQLQELYHSDRTSIPSVTEAYLQRIREIDHSGPELRSVLTINPEAMHIAQQLEAERKAGKLRGPLHGVPVLLKDNIDTHDRMPTTAGSRALANSFPLEDSPVAAQLRAAGAVILGKTNLSEWANFRGELSSSGWSGLGGQTKNPYDPTRNPCGSSSGSGVAVSANLALAAIGTETNGSIVCPAQANGIVGLKPTVGLISRTGIIPISFTQDTAGPMTRTVADAATLLGMLTATDSRDSKTLDNNRVVHPDYTVFLKPNGLQGKRIGYFTGLAGRNYKVDALFLEAKAQLEALGATLIELKEVVPGRANGISFQIMLYEYREGLEAYFKSLGDKSPIKSIEELIAFNEKDPVELQHFNQKYLEMALATTDKEAYENNLKQLMELTRQEGIDKVMNTHRLDAIIAPTGSPAWKTDWVNGDHYQIGSSGPAAMAGYPNLTVPMGFVDGLPVGISFYGRAWSEGLLLEIGYGFEQATKVRKPPVSAP